jgi:hypothetical protein
MNDLTVEPQKNEPSDTQVSGVMQPRLESLLLIEQAIKDRISKIELLKKEMEPHKEMLASYLENDPVYREHNEAAKKATKQKSATKKQLLTIPAGRAIVEKITELKSNLSELEEGLSYYLREFQAATGANEIEGLDGELRQIVYMAKLVRKTQLNK